VVPNQNDKPVSDQTDTVTLKPSHMGGHLRAVTTPVLWVLVGVVRFADDQSTRVHLDISIERCEL